MQLATVEPIGTATHTAGQDRSADSPKNDSKAVKFLKKIFASSGSSMLAKGAMGIHDVVEIDNDIPDNLVPSIVKHHKNNPGLQRSSGDSRAYHETAVNELQYLAGDFASLQKNASKLTDQVRHTHQLAKQTHIEGMSSAVGLLTGYVASMRGHVEAKESYHVGDKGGMFAGVATAIRGPFEAFGNTASAVSSGIQAFETPAKVASMTKVMTGLGIVSTIGSGFFYLLLGAPAAYSIYESGSMHHKLKKIEAENGSAAAFKFLQEKLRINDDDRRKILDELFKDKDENCLQRASRRFFDWVYGYKSDKTQKVKESIKELIEKEQYDSSEMKAALKVVDPDNKIIKLLSKEDRKFIGKYINDNFKDKNLTSQERANLIRTIAVFYKAGINVVSARKEKLLCRTIGSEAVGMVKSRLRTKDPSKIKLETLQQAVKSAKKGLVKSLIINVAIVVGCVLGLVGTLIGTIMTGGIFPLVSTIISVVSLAVWTGLDGYTLYEEFKSGNATTKDKVLMVLSTVMMVGVVLAGNLAVGTLAMALTGAFAFAWVMLLFYTIYNWRRKRNEASKVDPEMNRPKGRPISRRELRDLETANEEMKQRQQTQIEQERRAEIQEQAVDKVLENNPPPDIEGTDRQDEV